ncbi:hypothetical protein H4J55_13590 [Colwellia sp. MB3u-22]|nr:hypothetical protein [Colwellia sp. MB02u-7]MBA6237885.1 hypothetical protein [Colwellia sp. MB02u-11]MBA6300450.1 hypothetical protein [Colwellia sp. MB3u-22]MBA6302787.1 hypothetical protein [Colwellia sp. MB02u-14]MBA6311041.1 hypothetical protein [Colwellia sp. MB3u-64]
MSKVIPKLHIISELHDINQLIIPLKALADRERVSIYGLTGMVYTPYIDDYMQESIKKAAILACLKEQGILALSSVELISAVLEGLYKRAKNNAVVEYEGRFYQRRFSPLKLSKSGKVVHKWARYWFLQSPNGNVDPHWESEVREIWPSYFLIRTTDL